MMPDRIPPEEAEIPNQHGQRYAAGQCPIFCLEAGQSEDFVMGKNAKIRTPAESPPQERQFSFPLSGMAAENFLPKASS